MSNANSSTKVLRTALKRLQRGWTKGTFYSGPGDGTRAFWKKEKNNQAIPQVCLRGAIHGYQGQVKTAQTIMAEKAVLEAINEEYPKAASAVSDGAWETVMEFNDDSGTTFEMVEKVTKLGLIKLETGWEPESSGRL